jgi:hypothetical protein
MCTLGVAVEPDVNITSAGPHGSIGGACANEKLVARGGGEVELPQDAGAAVVASATGLAGLGAPRDREQVLRHALKVVGGGTEVGENVGRGGGGHG